MIAKRRATTKSKKKAKKAKRKKLTKLRSKIKKANAHLMYLEDVKPINQKTANGSSLSEAYGYNDPMPEFALLSADGRQIGPWMRCKDYIQDCIWGGMFKKSYSVHGFKYTHGTDPLPNLNKLHLAVRFRAKNKILAKMLENVKKTVEDLEERVNIPRDERTKFSRVLEDSYFVVYGSHHWLKATHTISFFTFMIRASFLNTGRKIETIGKTAPVKNDVYYFKGGRKYMEMLSKAGIEGVKANWDSYKNTDKAYTIHNAGFVNWSNKNGGKVTFGKKPKEDDNWEF
jgi:hypothetical protein